MEEEDKREGANHLFWVSLLCLRLVASWEQCLGQVRMDWETRGRWQESRAGHHHPGIRSWAEVMEEEGLRR